VQCEFPSLPAAATKAIAVHARARTAAVAELRGDEGADGALFMARRC